MKAREQNPSTDGKRKWLWRLAAVTIASIPMYNPSKLVSPIITLPDIFILAFVIWTLYSYGFPKTLFHGPFGWILIGTVVIPLFSLLMNLAIEGVVGDIRVVVRTFEAAVMALCIAWSLIRDTGIRDHLLHGLYWGLGFVVVEGWIQYFIGALSWTVFTWVLPPDWFNLEGGGSNYFGFRVYSLLDNPLNLIAYISIPMALLAWKLKQRWQILASIGFILTSAVGIFSGSKIAIPIIFISIFYWAWNNRKKMLLVFGLSLVGIIIVVAYLPKIEEEVLTINRLINLNDRRASVAQRQEVYSSTIEMINDHPFLGVGPGNYPKIYERSYRTSLASKDPTTFTSENFLLQIAAEQGVAGLLLILWLCIRLLLRFRFGGIHVGLAVGLLLFLLVGMIQSMTAVPIRLMEYILFGFSEGAAYWSHRVGAI